MYAAFQSWPQHNHTLASSADALLTLSALLSAMQVLFSLPEVAERYAAAAPAIFASAPADAAADLPTQMAKVGLALTSGKTGKPRPSTKPPAAAAASRGDAAEAVPMETDTADAAAAAAAAAAVGAAGGAQDAAHLGGGAAGSEVQEANSVRPAAFKALVGKGHPEFSSGRQQVGEEGCDSVTSVWLWLFFNSASAAAF
jgi:ubiquitin carboxyl-terminal hydrolase 5/13